MRAQPPWGSSQGPTSVAVKCGNVREEAQAVWETTLPCPRSVMLSLNPRDRSPSHRTGATALPRALASPPNKISRMFLVPDSYLLTMYSLPHSLAHGIYPFYRLHRSHSEGQ